MKKLMAAGFACLLLGSSTCYAGTIFACRKKVGGTIRIVGASTTCLATETKMSWPNTAEVTALENRLAALESLLQHFSRNGNDISITGANLWITSGRGLTDGPVNGLGNLIIGYNAPRPIDNARTGSHNLVIGDEQNYTSYGGMVVGSWNTISDAYASVCGGQHNTASGNWASVSGGQHNTASGGWAAVGGGVSNVASGGWTAVSGGVSNAASGGFAWVSGGSGNTAAGGWASMSGGIGNTASGDFSSVSGGDGNTASGRVSSVSGGEANEASGDYAAVSGGLGNTAGGQYSAVSGGSTRSVSGDHDWRAGELFQEE